MTELNYRKTLEGILPYQPGKPIDDVKRELGLSKVIKLASNENPLGCSLKAVEAVTACMMTPSLYPDGNCTELRNALSSKLNVKPEQLIFGAGSNEIVAFLGETFINPGDESVMAVPSFPWYETAVKMMDGIAIEIPLKNHTHDLETMKSKINDRTKIVWLCNPNNPTGTMYTAKEQDEFLKSVPSNVVVVLDEAYCEYVGNKDYPNSVPLLEKYPNVIILRTFSKVYGLASLRIGYGIANVEMISYLNRIRPPFNVNAAAQVAALASINDSDFVSKTVENNNAGKEFLYSSFKDMGLDYIPTECNFIMVDTKKDSIEIFNKLLAKGVIVRPGKGFRMPTWQRVTIGTPEENTEFISALKEVLA
jgi:histidinol-phosphate aminotransferase